jgi:hypothetical protein
MWHSIEFKISSLCKTTFYSLPHLMCPSLIPLMHLGDDPLMCPPKTSSRDKFACIHYTLLSTLGQELIGSPIFCP